MDRILKKRLIERLRETIRRYIEQQEWIEPEGKKDVSLNEGSD